MTKTIRYSGIESITYEFTLSEIIDALSGVHKIDVQSAAYSHEWIYPRVEEDDYSEPDPIGIRLVTRAETSAARAEKPQEGKEEVDEVRDRQA